MLSNQYLVNGTDINSNIIGFYSDLGDLAIFGGECVALAAEVAQNGRGVKVDFERFCEFGVGVGEEADLEMGGKIVLVVDDDDGVRDVCWGNFGG